MKTAATKTIRNEIRTKTHTVWFEPKTGTYELLHVSGARFTTGNPLAACNRVWPEDALTKHLFEVTALRETPTNEVDADDPREGLN